MSRTPDFYMSFYERLSYLNKVKSTIHVRYFLPAMIHACANISKEASIHDALQAILTERAELEKEYKLNALLLINENV